MALPKLDVPYYSLTLPCSGTKIKFRPFLVKEEKILLIAHESEDKETEIDAIKQVAQNCTDGKLDIDTLPLSDLAYLYVNIRCKSVGETIKIGFKCAKCSANNKVTLDLSKCKVEGIVKNANNIKLTDTIGIIMKYPSINLVAKFDDSQTVDNAFQLLIECIDSIYDGKQSHQRGKDVTDEEINDFLENLSKEQFGLIQKFMDNIPQLTQSITYKCDPCGHENKVELKGISDFFQ